MDIFYNRLIDPVCQHCFTLSLLCIAFLCRGKYRTTNNHSHSHEFTYSTNACLWTVGGNQSTWREPGAFLLGGDIANHSTTIWDHVVLRSFSFIHSYIHTFITRYIRHMHGTAPSSNCCLYIAS